MAQKFSYPKKLFYLYLDILQLEKESPSFDFLQRIISSQLRMISFENISKIYNYHLNHNREIPSFAEFLQGVVENHFGGTCYTLNFYLNSLLKWLGYKVILCGAEMSVPDAHLVNIVHFEGKRFLVDVGYSAPFIEPMDLELSHKIEIGYRTYLFKNNEGIPEIELFQNNQKTHGYRVNTTPREIHEFGHVIAQSYNKDATFMNSLLISKGVNNGTINLHNDTLFEYYEGVSKITRFNNKNEIIEAAHEHFSVPKDILSKSIGQLNFSISALG